MSRMSTFKKGDWARFTHQHCDKDDHIGRLESDRDRVTCLYRWVSLKGRHWEIPAAELEPWVPRVDEWVMVRGVNATAPHRVVTVHEPMASRGAVYLTLDGFYPGCAISFASPCLPPRRELSAGMWLALGSTKSTALREVRFRLDKPAPVQGAPGRWACTRIEARGSGMIAQESVLYDPRNPMYRALPQGDEITERFEDLEREGKIHIYPSRAAAKLASFAAAAGSFGSGCGAATPERSCAQALVEHLEAPITPISPEPRLPERWLPSNTNTTCFRCGQPAYVGLGALEGIECAACDQYGARQAAATAAFEAGARERRNLARKHPETSQFVGSIRWSGEPGDSSRCRVDIASHDIHSEKARQVLGGRWTSYAIWWQASLAGVVAYGPTEETAIAAWRKKARGAQ